MLAFENKIIGDRDSFVFKLVKIASELKTNPDWLMGVMWAESKLNPAAQNTAFPVNGGYATGLIQFTPDTARALGTSTVALKDMTASKQLDYVKKYFTPYIGRLNSFRDVYLCVFFPAAVGKPDGWVFETSKLSRSSIARSNPVIDQNSDGKITMLEFEQYLKKIIPLSLQDLFFAVWKKAVDNKGLTALIIISLIFIFKK